MRLKMTMNLNNIELKHYYNSESLDCYILYYSDVKLGTFTLSEDQNMKEFIFNPTSDYYSLDEAEAILWATHKLKEDNTMESE